MTGEEMSNMSEGLKGPTLEDYSSSIVQYSTVPGVKISIISH